ncbi:hypothetical protein MCUN1_002944 [Malassezia cuniculi]|uniref:t-SNARE coiled-coil homology domain-containing protein n=1 Tax=Malassezia cuniculi TaxID=948313 RepID=A0AAF0J7B6_9BASI|nr:hypothetical protein MCUN1_002944 [Malassezia cuniculi]
MADASRLAAQSPQAAAPRFDYLCSNTRTQLEERNRLVREHGPSAARDRAILRNLYTLCEALSDWRATEPIDTLEPWRQRVHALVEEFGYDDLLQHPGLEPLEAPHSPSDDAHELIDDIDTPSALPDTIVRVPPPEMEMHQQMMDEQDSRLDMLAASISRQHMLSVQMNDELEIQSGLISGLDQDVESTGLRLGGASNQLERLRRTASEHGSLWIIFVLIIVLVLLIALVK